MPTMMLAQDVRSYRSALGYTVPVLAEVLHVEARLLRDWESGAIPPPEWLRVALQALVDARTQPDDDLLIASGTFASRRRMLELSKLQDLRAAAKSDPPKPHHS